MMSEAKHVKSSMQRKLRVEMSRKPHNLRRLCGHFNLYASLLQEIQIAEALGSQAKMAAIPSSRTVSTCCFVGAPGRNKEKDENNPDTVIENTREGMSRDSKLEAANVTEPNIEHNKTLVMTTTDYTRYHMELMAAVLSTMK